MVVVFLWWSFINTKNGVGDLIAIILGSSGIPLVYKILKEEFQKFSYVGESKAVGKVVNQESLGKAASPDVGILLKPRRPHPI